MDGKKCYNTMRSETLSFSSVDGLLLEGTLLLPTRSIQGMAVLVHGGGSDRNEGGFYRDLALALARAKIASFRFDWRTHGRSEGCFEDMTLLGIVNDIYAATEEALSSLPLAKAHVIGASFGGGLCVYYATHYPERVASLVLLNPLLNYKQRLLEEKAIWQGDRVTTAGGEELRRRGWIAHTSAFAFGRGLLNELLYIAPQQEVAHLLAPVLTIHGTADSVLPFARVTPYLHTTAHAQLLPIEGADHGFAVQGDQDYTHPQTRSWQRQVIQATVRWIQQHL
jgi:pimeloyl-ACP methyl ester carboxylesterase